MNYARKVAALKRRRDYLLDRIKTAEKMGRDLSYDKAEFSALDWVIPLAEKEAAVPVEFISPLALYNSASEE